MGGNICTHTKQKLVSNKDMKKSLTRTRTQYTILYLRSMLESHCMRQNNVALVWWRDKKYVEEVDELMNVSCSAAVGTNKPRPQTHMLGRYR